MQAVVIAGPPLLGKTTLSTSQAAMRGGVVLDWDDTWTEVTDRARHDVDDGDRAAITAVEQEFQRRIGLALASRQDVWLIRTAPTRSQRAMLRRLYSATTVVLAVPERVCLDRLALSGRPDLATARIRAAVRRWWSAYEPSDRDDLTLAGWVVGVDPLAPLLGERPQGGGG